MTTAASSSEFAEAVVEVVTDLSRELLPDERYRRLLRALRRIFPCDAAAVLQLRGEVLQPLAVSGLSEDTLGRRFSLAEQPRLARILLSSEPLRFLDSDLPDPYDGLIEGLAHALPVHDCLGAALYIDGLPWGLLTLDALQPGIFDHIDPLALRAFIRLTEASVKVARTIEHLRARADHEHQISQALQRERGRHELIGKSAAMQTLQRHIDTVAQSDLVVLILGETGVGKELVAQQLHRRSARAERPLVHINCAALPESLAESELFGHNKGAFTGASADRAGKFELADGGTLFLDEIGELPLSIQAKLLRAIQSGEIQRLGSDQLRCVDVRIVAATNRDLKQEVADGRFRADLYHRLSVFPITVPPLRERGRDVLTLAGYFLENNQRRLQVRSVRLSAPAKQMLLDYAWPGNVRELEHLMSRAALLAKAEKNTTQRWITIGAEHLGLRGEVRRQEPPVGDMAMAVSLAEATEHFQKDWLRGVLAVHRGNLSAAARAAGIDRSNFHRLLKRLALHDLSGKNT